MNIKDFRRDFIQSVLEKLNEEKYVYKGYKFLLFKEDKEHLYYIYIYTHKRGDFIEIETKVYYSNKDIQSKLKLFEIIPYNEYICGGEIASISKNYLKKDFPERYSNLIYMVGEDISDIVDKWISLYKEIIVPFFYDCSIPENLNYIMNESDLFKTSTLCLKDEDRYKYSYFIGEKAGIPKEKLKEYADNFEKYIRENNLTSYYSDYLNLKGKLFKIDA